MTKNVIFKHICREDTYMFHYTQLPDELFTIDLFTSLSLHAKVLYSFMLRRVSISKDNGWIDEAGDVYIYFRVDEIMEKFNCSNKTAAKIMSELEEIGLIEKRRQGQGKPDIIFVNKFSEVTEMQEEEPELPIDHLELLEYETEEDQGEITENPEVKKVHFKKCKNYTSKDVKSTLQEVKNLHANYKENNYKDIVNSSSLSPPEISCEQVRLMEEEEERLKERIRYQEAERAYSAQIAYAAYEVLKKRDKAYRERVNADLFAKVCKAVSVSKEPIISMSGFINWCYDSINFDAQPKHPAPKPNQFSQFMQTDYGDMKRLEKELVGH